MSVTPCQSFCLWAHAGQNWTRLEPVAVMGSVTRGGYHTQCVFRRVCEAAFAQICVCVVMYEETNLPIEPQGHASSCHKQAALVISKAVNIDYLKWLSHYTHKFALITHPWVDILRFCFEKCKANIGSSNRAFVNSYLSPEGSL